MVSIGLTAYVIVDTTNDVGGDDGTAWVVEVVVLEVVSGVALLEVVVLEVPPADRVIGATVLRGGVISRVFTLGVGALAARFAPLVAPLREESRVAAIAVPNARRIMPAARTAVESL
jgi:hypothetical protein